MTLPKGETIFNMIENNLNQPETMTGELNDKNEDILTRDEIVLRRKLKVAARKKNKKIEKMQLSKNSPVEIVEKPEFSLHAALEDFPTLNDLKIKKRINVSNQKTLIDVEKDLTEKSLKVNENKNSKNVEKSWKPKIKDPIQIDLSQALLNKTEKHKLGLKKSDPPIQRNVLAGNILDSDNPTMKKGKVRPDKVQKPSKLKSHILSERKKKKTETKENNCEISDYSKSDTPKNDDLQQNCMQDKVYETELDRGFTCSVSSVNERKTTETNQNETFPVCNTRIHSRRFREYCTNCLTEEVISSVCTLLEKIAYFQDRMFAREPIKASAKRRYVAGINQVNKYLRVKKVKILVIAPDLEKIPGEGGLDERVQQFKMEAESQGIPCVFGPNRKQLGKAVKKNTLVSCVAVLSYEGAEEQYAQVLEALHEGKIKYSRLTGHHENEATTSLIDLIKKAEEDCVSVSDVTSSLLATLREELQPAERLMNAIQHSGSRAEK